MEVAAIKGQDGEVVGEGRCPERKVEIGDKLPATTKEEPHFGKALHDTIIDIQKTKGTEKLSKGNQMRLRIRVAKRAFIYFPDRNPANGNTLRHKPSDNRSGFRFASQCLNNPVGINNVAHYGLLSGREPSSRAR